MPFVREAEQWGLAKESSRLTVVSAPTKYFPVELTSEMKIDLKHLPDKALRGLKAEYPMFAGVKDVSGKIHMPLRAQQIGEFLIMMYGNVPVPVQQGGTSAYLATFTGPQANAQGTTYSLFVKRDTLTTMAYNGCAAKKITWKGAVDQYVMMEVDVLGLNESTIGGAFSATYTESNPLNFYQTTVKVGGSTVTYVKDYEFSVDTGLFLKRTQNTSQLALDIIQAKRWKAQGKMTVFFEVDTDRQNFLSNTTTSIEFIQSGDIIASTYHYALDTLFPKCHYMAYPYGEVEGLYGAQVQFDAVYDTGTAQLINQQLTNTNVSY